MGDNRVGIQARGGNRGRGCSRDHRRRRDHVGIIEHNLADIRFCGATGGGEDGGAGGDGGTGRRDNHRGAGLESSEIGADGLFNYIKK